jgi:hypothetical protein
MTTIHRHDKTLILHRPAAKDDERHLDQLLLLDRLLLVNLPHDPVVVASASTGLTRVPPPATASTELTSSLVPLATASTNASQLAPPD